MVKRIEYNIVALTVNGAHFDLVKGLESEEDAKALLAKIMERITQRKGRYVSLGDVVFDPSHIVAYCVREWDVWDPEECTCAVTDDTNEVEVIDLNAPAETDIPASDGDSVDEVL